MLAVFQRQAIYRFVAHISKPYAYYSLSVHSGIHILLLRIYPIQTHCTSVVCNVFKILGQALLFFLSLDRRCHIFF